MHNLSYTSPLTMDDTYSIYTGLGIYQPACTLVVYSQTSFGWLTRSEGIRLTPASSTLPYSSSFCCCCSTLGLLSHTPPHYPRGENLVEWMAPDRGRRGRNVSLALEGSHPPEQWRTAQSLLINHCQGCPGPGPNNRWGQALFFSCLSYIRLKNSHTGCFYIIY